MRLPRVSTACRSIRAQIARRGSGGQGTVEYALVLFAFLSLFFGAGALWGMLDAATPVHHALQSASHHVQSVAPGAVSDVFLY